MSSLKLLDCGTSETRASNEREMRVGGWGIRRNLFIISDLTYDLTLLLCKC